MAIATTCYICGKITPLRCMTPGCSHTFCQEHGDFMCRDCHQKSGQQHTTAIHNKETRNGIISVVVGVLIAIVVGIFAVIFEIIKEVFRGL